MDEIKYVVVGGVQDPNGSLLIEVKNNLDKPLGEAVFKFNIIFCDIKFVGTARLCMSPDSNKSFYWCSNLMTGTANNDTKSTLISQTYDSDIMDDWIDQIKFNIMVT